MQLNVWCSLNCRWWWLLLAWWWRKFTHDAPSMECLPRRSFMINVNIPYMEHMGGIGRKRLRFMHCRLFKSLKLAEIPAHFHHHLYRYTGITPYYLGCSNLPCHAKWYFVGFWSDSMEFLYYTDYTLTWIVVHFEMGGHWYIGININVLWLIYIYTY